MTEIRTTHIFHCVCGNETTQECVTVLDGRSPSVPSLPRGWKAIGRYLLCPDEAVEIRITAKDGKRVWFETRAWMGE